MLLDSDSFIIIEKKTKKRREIKVNYGFQKHILDCYKKLNIKDKNEKCFISRKRTVYSVQRINNLFKEIKVKYNLKVEHFSTHSMRKTFGYHHYKKFRDLALLQKIFNHSNPQVTLRYIGIEQDQIEDSYTNFVL